VREYLGRGQTIEQISCSMQLVAEGIPTTESAYACARQLNLDTPITDEVYALLYEGKTPVQAMHDLIERDQKAEEI